MNLGCNNYIKKKGCEEKMKKIDIKFLLSVMYALPTSVIFLNFTTNGIRINTLTLLVFLLNILATIGVYKIGEGISNWLE